MHKCGAIRCDLRPIPTLMFLRALKFLLLLSPLLLPGVAGSEVSDATGRVAWRPHAWGPAGPVGPPADTMETLPADEEKAREAICRAVSSLPPDAHLLAASSSGFHPALNSFCLAFNVTCVFLDALEGERVPDDWLHNAIRFFPAPELRSQSVYEYITWAMWTNFVVLYCDFHNLESIHSVFNYPMGPVLFRHLDLDDAHGTQSVLRQLKLSTINNFILDMPHSQILKFLKLASEANLKGLARSFLLIREINSTFFKEQMASRVWAGMNFTSHLFDGVEFVGDEPRQRRNKTSALELLMNAAHSYWLSRWASAGGALRAGFKNRAGAWERCGSLGGRVHPAAGEFRQLLEKQIEQQVGTVMIDGKRLYNFSFSVYHMYTERDPETKENLKEMNDFATWTAQKGFVMAPGASNRHQRHFREFMNELNLTVVTVIDPPFSFERDFDDNGNRLYGNDRWTGFSIELFKRVASVLNLTYTIRVSSDGQFGGLVENDSDEQVWSGTVGELMAGTADVAVASLVITYDRERVVDFTTPYTSLGLSVIMKKPEQQTDPLQFMLPFSGRVWTCMLLAWLLTSLLMLVCARLSPYEWYSHNDCVPVVENQFGALNSMWFTIGSLMQQGSDLAPRASSTRMVATTWWFFTLLLISSYTANLAAFLTTSRLGNIDSVEALASQSKVKFGCPVGGAMYNFFKNSKITVYRRMWDSMVSWSAKNESFVGKTSEGIGRVREGGYAYILESTFNQYYRERDCELTQIGGIFNPSSYAFAVPQGNVLLRDELSEVILKLHKEQFIEDLSDAWIKRFNLTGPPCSEVHTGSTPDGTLDVASFGGVFVSMLVGLGVAVLLCFIELMWRSATLAMRTQRSFADLCIEQLRLAFHLAVNRKSPPVKSSPALPPPRPMVSLQLPQPSKSPKREPSIGGSDDSGNGYGETSMAVAADTRL
ncbi:hypothetical protein BOX15_Mlig000674g1 [Macrostomum lignano]|uniref:PBPe domain-containing protein n=2 Tax=Macrostomum lignano TaxID=282301 RepID=A0A267GR23_9PLAT|nr:hypothetical protein BOX15_Mlig000674g1 [Macrostomum lignano]